MNAQWPMRVAGVDRARAAGMMSQPASRLDPPSLQAAPLDRLSKLARYSGFSVVRLAQVLEVNKRSLHRWFRAEFNCSPGEWLAQQRMSEAMAMLREGWAIKEVTDALGYHQVPQFCREFRRRLGCTPTEFVSQRIDCLRVLVVQSDAASLPFRSKEIASGS